MLASRMRMAASASALDWFLAGGAPTPIAVYNVREGGSLAGSYVNIINPGTFNAAPGVAPTWSGVTGWGLNGTQYLLTGIVPAAGYAGLVRVSNITGVNQWAFGCIAGGSNSTFGVVPNRSTNSVLYGQGGTIEVSPAGTSGVFGVAGQRGYRNGTAEGASIVAWGGSGETVDIGIGIRNLSSGQFPGLTGNILYFVIWDTDVDHATWMPQVSAAVSAL